MAGQIVEVNGHPTWIEDRSSPGSRGTVLLLHGGLSSSDSMLATFGASLESDYRVVAFDRRGHGYTADSDAPFHYDDMATETIGVIETIIDGPTHLVGYSDGGIVSLLVAMQRPDLVESLVLIGTNFHHEGVHPLEIDPNSDFLATLVAEYSERSPDGAEHFGEVVGKFMAMATTEPTLTVEALSQVQVPSLVMAGDDDLVKLSHTIELFEALPRAQLAIVPGASHGLPIEQPAVVCEIAKAFLQLPDAAATLMPIRRSASQ